MDTENSDTDHPNGGGFIVQATNVPLPTIKTRQMGREKRLDRQIAENRFPARN